MKVIISGGGTGGHVYPAIAIANALKKKLPSVEILFVGANGKLEMEKVPRAGYKIEGLDVVGFHRKKLWRNIGFPWKLYKSLRRAKKIIDNFGPDIVVGVGGYASGPVLKQAQRKNIPTVIQEQNSYPGITNKLLGKHASLICVAYDHMERFFPKDKIVITGNPVRTDLVVAEEKISTAYTYFNLDSNEQTTLIFGGSLGARSLNNAVHNSFDFLKKNADTQFIWQVGSLYYEEFVETQTAQLSNVQVKAFIDRMDYAYAVADTVVCRAGALTISELALVAKPAILIPSPNVSEDHQTKNAQALEKIDAAVLVRDDEIHKWESELKDLLTDKEKRKRLSKHIKKYSKPDAAEQIADMVYNLVHNE